MEIILAETAGFCWGVKLALDKVLEASEDPSEEKVRTFGPLIHNPQVIEMLQGKGIEVVSDVESLSDGTVVVRAHGVPPQVKQEFERKGLKIVDATCPHVVSSQKRVAQADRDGYEIVIVGDDNHPEVVGLVGFTAKKPKILSTLAEARAFKPKTDRLCVIGQSTFSEAEFGEICETLREQATEVDVFSKSICNATSERQDEVADMSEQVDAMVVIGGRNSANTRRLAELSRLKGVETFYIEQAADLDLEQIVQFKRVGVTAGASTPAWLIEEVVDRLEQIRAAG